MDDFGLESIALMKAGRTLVIDDVHTDARSNGSLAAKSNEAIGARSVIVLPLVRDGMLVATLFVHHTDPRVWHRDDIALVEDMSDRLWGAVLRARRSRHRGAVARAGGTDWHRADRLCLLRPRSSLSEHQ